MFEKITIGKSYSRPELADIWGYKSFHAIARGVVTPRKTNKIILFVTEEKQAFQQQYQDQLDGTLLFWEGPTDYYAEPRMLAAHKNSDEIHLFHRDKHHSDFTYIGILELESFQTHTKQPSSFVFRVK